MDNDAIHGDEHIKLIEGMTIYEQFAVNHYLQEYDEEGSFEEILRDLMNDNDTVPFEIYDASLSWEEIADSIIQMASDLEKTFK